MFMYFQAKMDRVFLFRQMSVLIIFVAAPVIYNLKLTQFFEQ